MLMKCNKETTSPIELLNFIKMCAKGGREEKKHKKETGKQERQR